MASGKKIFFAWWLGTVVCVLLSAAVLLAFPELAVAGSVGGQPKARPVDWTFIISSTAVASIFAGAWLGGRAYKVRAEMQRAMEHDRQEVNRQVSAACRESLAQYNENKGRIAVLETNFGNIKDDLAEIKEQQHELSKKLDEAIRFMPKREANHSTRD